MIGTISKKIAKIEVFVPTFISFIPNIAPIPLDDKIFCETPINSALKPTYGKNRNTIDIVAIIVIILFLINLFFIGMKIK